MKKTEYEIKYKLGEGEYIRHLCLIGNETLNIKFIKDYIAKGIINEISHENVEKSILYYDVLNTLINNIQIVEIY